MTLAPSSMRGPWLYHLELNRTPQEPTSLCNHKFGGHSSHSTQLVRSQRCGDRKGLPSLDKWVGLLSPFGRIGSLVRVPDYSSNWITSGLATIHGCFPGP